MEKNKNIYRNLLFERSDDPILIIKNGRFMDCNEATVKMLRYKNKKELLDTHPSELSPEFQPDGKPSFEKADEMMRIAFEKGTHRFEWDHKRADGEVFPVEVLLTDISIDANEKILNTVWRDITGRKKSERMQNAIYRISESTYTASDMSALYKKIHNIISELITVKNIYIALYDEESKLLTFPYFVDEYDPPQPSKKLGKGLTEYVLRTGEACLVDEKKDLELRAQDKVDLIGSPTKIWLGVPLKISGKSIGVIVVQDYDDENAFGEEEKQLLIFVSEQIAQVIERKQNAVKLKKYAEELKEANKTKDKFFSIIAHELKSPFQGLLGYSKILTTEYATITEEERIFFINSIDEISKNAFLLLEDLLTWSRLQTNKMEIKIEKFNLYENLSQTIALLKQTALNKGIMINNFIDNKIYVKADKNMVCTIARNIISNAVKFTNKGGEITVSSNPVENFVELSIKDTGVGIEKKNLDKFFVIDKTFTTKGTANEEGTGLGLLLCKEMIEKQGGKIWAESEPGKGSNFVFTIPTLN